MGNLASDIDNPQFVGAVPDNTGLAVRFYKDVRKNEWQSKEQGRPIFEDVVMIHIAMPGNNTFDVQEVVQDRHKGRFPLQWAAFQNAQDGKDPLRIGTPVEQWPLVSRAQAEELKALKFYTVDAIANASDLQLQGMGMGIGMAPTALRERAARFLAAARDDAAVNRQAEEIERLRREQRDSENAHATELAKVQQQVAALTALIQAKRKPGRPPKVTDG